MPKKLGIGAALLAEFVARGAANKISIINAFSGDVLVGEFPVELNFGIYLELHFKGGTPSSPITFEVLLNGKRIVGGVAGEVPSISPDEPAVIAIPMFPLRVEEDSTLEMYVTAEGYGRTRAMRKKISKGILPAS